MGNRTQGCYDLDEIALDPKLPECTAHHSGLHAREAVVDILGHDPVTPEVSLRVGDYRSAMAAVVCRMVIYALKQQHKDCPLNGLQAVVRDAKSPTRSIRLWNRGGVVERVWGSQNPSEEVGIDIYPFREGRDYRSIMSSH